MDSEMLNMVLDTIDRLEKDRLPTEKKMELDRKGEFPTDLIKFMLGPELALHLVFIPAEYGGLGAGATEIAAVSERMARMDLGIATSFLAICLGMDPLRVGATEEQKQKYIARIAEQGLIVGYGVTEPEAGSNVQALKTKAERVLDEDGRIKGYKVNGQKQFITNGGVAQLYTILAEAPDGPSFFVVEQGREGLIPGKHEDKHGIRASDTCPLVLEDLYIPVEDLIGGVEGQGLKQANEVFGYTRLMVATFGLGGGMAALEKAVAYSKERVQFGTTLSDKQGYTHGLLVPNAVRLEAARAYIEETARRLDTDEEDLQVEGSISKFFATEAGDKAANDAIQALGGYGYIREYEVEKIKRDIKITTIFEGTSEIQRNIISIFRMRTAVRSKGAFYDKLAEELEALPEESGAMLMGKAVRVLNPFIFAIRKKKLTRAQHVMFLLADMIAWCEVGSALCKKAAGTAHGKRSTDFTNAASRLFAMEVVDLVYQNGSRIAKGCGEELDDASQALESLNPSDSVAGYMEAMDLIAKELVA